MAEQLWSLNAAWRERYEYPHYIDLINPKSEQAQKESDERELAKVREWLLGGDTK